MSEDSETVDANDEDLPIFRVRLPGFVTDDEIGLGDVVTRGVSRVGIRPCAGCGRRAAALSRWAVFTGRPR